MVTGKKDGSGKYVWAYQPKSADEEPPDPLPLMGQYQGEYHANKRHGKGIYIYPKGDKYDGKLPHRNTLTNTTNPPDLECRALSGRVGTSVYALGGPVGASPNSQTCGCRRQFALKVDSLWY